MSAEKSPATAVDPGEVDLGSGLDLRITLYKLDIFCQVVEAGGVTRAADQLILTQPVVTGHIRSLEERLGSKLFSRSGRHNVLTEAGERTYHWGKKILRAAGEMHRELEEVGHGSGGSVTIAAGMSAGSYLLPPLIAQFIRTRPNVHVSLAVSDQAGAQQAVQVGDADFAIAIGEAGPQPDWLECEAIGEEDLVVVASPELASETPLSREDLMRIPFVESPISGRGSLADRRLSDFGIPKRQVVLEMGHPEAIKRAVEEGIGVAMLFRGAVDGELQREELVELRVDGIDLTFPVLLMVRADRELSPAAALLLEEIRAAGAAPLTPA